jgi:serine/threonine protein kinase
VKLSEEQKIELIQEIAAGMFHLHKHNIVHRDLAARNILLSNDGKPKISVRSLVLSILVSYQLNSIQIEFYIFFYYLIEKNSYLKNV